jgi:hypothetical protein
MRKSRPRYPRPQDVAQVKAALERSVPTDGPMRMGWRESNKLVPNWRFLAATGGVEWVVDVYCGGYCYVSVGRSAETVRSVPAVIRFLRTHLAARNAKTGRS